MREQVIAALQDVRPFLQRDGGDVEFVDYTADKVLQVRLRGACGSCPGATMTLKMGIERFIKERVPELVRVENVP